MSINILGVKVNTEYDIDSFMAEADKLIQSNTNNYICTTNPEFILEAQSDKEFRNIVNSSAISTADGVGVLLAEEYLKKIKEVKNASILTKVLLGMSIGLKHLSITSRKNKISGSEIMMPLCKMCEEKSYNIFLLGGWPKDMFGNMLQGDHDIASDLANKISKIYPNIQIIGSTSKYSYKESDDTSTLSFIREKMQESNVKRIDMLFVAYGQNKQEKWIKRNKDNIPASLCIGLGGTFDYLLSDNNKTLNYFKKYNIEWLYRLLTQPYRLKRVLNAMLVFPIKVMLNS